MIAVEKLIIQEPAYCAGFHLPPLTLGHYLMLCDRGSAYVTGDWESKPNVACYNELAMALTLCRLDYDIAHALLSTTSRKDFNRAVEDTNLAIIDTDKNVVSVSVAFSTWWAAHTEYPEFQGVADTFKTPVGSEYALRLLCSANRILGLDAHRATRTSYALLVRAHAHDMEERGYCRVITEDLKARQQAVQAQLEEEIAKDGEEG
jgi:hypothetical protein